MSLERKSNILAQQFQVKVPDEVWVSDVTYFNLKGKTYYVCAILDLFARKIISYNVSDRNSTRLTMKTFDKAFSYRRPSPEKLLFHSDNGANYTSRAIISHLKELGVKQSFSRPGISYDNSVMESFFKSFKAEELYIGRYKSEKDFKQGVANYMEFYNNKRPHSVIRYSTPQKYEDRYYNKNKNKT